MGATSPKAESIGVLTKVIRRRPREPPLRRSRPANERCPRKEGDSMDTCPVKVGMHIVNLNSMADAHWERNALFIHFNVGRFACLEGMKRGFGKCC
jgi:hypothetical protein